MNRFFLKDDKDILSDSIKIDAYDLNHMKNVLRFKDKERFLIISDYIEYLCEYDEENPKFAKIVSKRELEQERGSIKLFFNVLKNNNTELIIQKCTELGVSEFYPVISKRSVVKMTKNDEKKIMRWQKIAESAAKQSEQIRIPIVHNIIEISDIYKFLDRDSKLIVPYEEAKTNHIKDCLKELNSDNISILIGPEGGFEIKEIDQLKSQGAIIVTLGENILRAETAAIVSSWEAYNAIKKS
ncbi:MAG: RsmE family RNA methyltransferase [Tissierellia bacterium]|nr:RsmE family RNA methyltransferase [Tissierellia bacterium]